MRLRFSVPAGALAAVVTAGLAWPVGAQPPPPAIQRPPAQPVTPRDPGSRPPDPVGTGVIRGKVVAGDTGNPVRRANVNLLPMAPPMPPPTSTGTNPVPSVSVTPMVMGRPKMVTTDAQGAFEFTALPAGSYRLTASAGQYSAAYLGIAYGAKKPNSPGSTDMGTPIQLANGQAFEKAVIALPRGAVITGRVTDEGGDPLARVQVYTLFYAPGSGRGMRMNGASTDDLGQFRLFGLAPGDYTVVAEARGNTFVQPNAPPESEEDKIGFMITYYPGTADEGAAQRVRTRAGAETPGVEIRMVTGRLFHITGSVVDSQGKPAARTSGNLWKKTAGSVGGSTSFGFQTDEQGRFQMRNIPPGTYRLGVQQRPVQFSSDGTRSEPGEMASVPINLASDLDNLFVVTSPGATITGQIFFEQGPPAQMPTGIRVTASAGNPDEMMGMPTPQAATVTPDLTFTMKGMLGEFLLRTSAPNQYLKAVMVGGDDVSDTPHEFKNGERVTLVLTSRASTLEGNVTDAEGKPTIDSGLILFSEDKSTWRMNSLKTRRTGTDQNGHYRMTGLLPGRYFVAAVPRDRLSIPFGVDATFFEQLSKEATSVVLGEDDQRQVDLKVVVGGGGL